MRQRNAVGSRYCDSAYVNHKSPVQADVLDTIGAGRAVMRGNMYLRMIRDMQHDPDAVDDRVGSI